MFPSASKLFSGMTAAAGNITKQNMAKSSTSMTVVNEGEEGNINLQTWKKSIILFFSQRKSERNDLAKICIVLCKHTFLFSLTFCTQGHRLQSDTDKWRPLLVDKF